MTPQHAIVWSQCPQAECEAWLYLGGPPAADIHPAPYVVVRMPHTDSHHQIEPRFPEGFHVAHVCKRHAMFVLDKSDGK